MVSDSVKVIATLIGLVVLIVLLTAYPVMLLWNWLMPMIFGLPTIGFWESLGLITLFRLLIPTTTTYKKKE